MLEQILKKIEKVLSFLPFNGKKTELSLIGLVLGYLVPEVEPTLIAQLNESSIRLFNEAVIFYGILGVFHGRLKKRFGK